MNWIQKTFYNIFNYTPADAGYTEEVEEKCDHDWATVSEYKPRDLLQQMIGPYGIRKEKRYRWGTGERSVWAYDFDMGYAQSCSTPTLLKSYDFYVSMYNVADKVCLKCGECFRGKDGFVAKVMDQMKAKIRHDEEMRDRKSLAKKMWEEGCKK